MKLKKSIITFAILAALAGVAVAQRKNVGAAEVNGTFKANDGANVIKVFSVGRGGPDNPGYNLQVELFVSLQLGPNGEARGNTGLLRGFAPIEGDTAKFTPDGMEYDKCTVTLKFVRRGVMKVTQQGDCGFINDMLTLAGTYKKTSNATPKFMED